MLSEDDTVYCTGHEEKKCFKKHFTVKKDILKTLLGYNVVTD